LYGCVGNHKNEQSGSSSDLFQPQIVQLERNNRQQIEQVEPQRIKSIDKVSVTSNIVNGYLHDFENHFAQIGFTCNVTLDIGITSEGSIHSIRINKSSGNITLDEAAIKIVQTIAPFPALPKEFFKELDVLVITRDLRLINQSSIAKESSQIVKDNNNEKPHLSPELLRNLLKDINQQTTPSGSQRLKQINAIRGNEYIVAKYLKDFESKVESTGNMNYPKVAMQKGFSGTLTIDVGINADGTLHSIQINKSSGNIALDEEAMKIVRLSAPFAALPTDLLKDLDVLTITRVFRFTDQSGVTR
jgi:TonB family protein